MQLNATLTPSLAAVLDRFHAVRRHTVSLAQPLSEEDCCVQSMPDASPVKWHMAHVTWFFETFILEAFEPEFKPCHPAFRMLFNSYYNGVGDKHVRAHRGMLTRPSLDEVLAYRHQVDTRIAALIDLASHADYPLARAINIAELMQLGVQHEQQHQELMLTDLKHLLWSNPLKPVYVPRSAAPDIAAATHTAPTEWLEFDGGLTGVGAGNAGASIDDFCFDNELPRHNQWLEPFALSATLVSNADYLKFMDAGGYADPMLWLSEGWDWLQTNRIDAPLYWQADAAGIWQTFTLAGMQPLDLRAAANHLSYFEADAYARWHGERLPTEAEWEHAATHANPEDMADLFNLRWQWTSSSYGAYPGFQPAAGATGEYNGKFMVNQYVLRGSSFATPVGHSRPTYRNFFPTSARWQFSGLRLAKSRL